jgi:hypothetical protein
MLIRATHAAFEQGEIAFDRIRRYDAARELLDRVIDGLIFPQPTGPPQLKRPSGDTGSRMA